MDPSLIVAIAVVTIMLLVLARSAILMPEQHAYVVERLGRYAQTLDPGLPPTSAPPPMHGASPYSATT